MALLCTFAKNVHNPMLFSSLPRQAILGHDDHFLLIARLLLILKGELIKLKIVALAITVRGIAYFYDFFDVSQLSYKPSNFARANKPYATG